ncbi:uncharacterized protein LACBIDRAFT_309623 [Laccaria bicolor S238N-H82]|uniref:Predicted protein n=1 Tax=Laccaria bicolor (strain S238N-H82 / ATCC MYA-4686) TaxID=486041 RepID=B0DSP6_LACBS|nr:uncharacterized protein LACBIDRAFT_309623 [Laccaria bicolor S238N-H82]EDR02358.1 predicted protein [Laccaria bicolor S238N-H82]|eukprot:XP_001887035.1 predicted protein [Laccaria bicolor S238N-H82]
MCKKTKADSDHLHWTRSALGARHRDTKSWKRGDEEPPTSEPLGRNTVLRSRRYLSNNEQWRYDKSSKFICIQRIGRIKTTPHRCIVLK